MVEAGGSGGGGDELVTSGNFREPIVAAIGCYKMSCRAITGFQGWWAKLFGKPHHVIEMIAKMGDRIIYEVCMDDNMAEGEAPVLGCEDEDASDVGEKAAALDDGGHVSSSNGDSLPFEIDMYAGPDAAVDSLNNLAFEIGIYSEPDAAE